MTSPPQIDGFLEPLREQRRGQVKDEPERNEPIDFPKLSAL
jgi:hypothetical protein